MTGSAGPQRSDMSARGRPERELRPLGGSVAAKPQAWGDVSRGAGPSQAANCAPWGAA